MYDLLDIIAVQSITAVVQSLCDVVNINYTILHYVCYDKGSAFVVNHKVRLMYLPLTAAGHQTNPQGPNSKQPQPY